MTTEHETFLFEQMFVGGLIGSAVTYRVPRHQRNFAWGPEEWEQLWEDTLEAMADGRRTYFLGTMVVRRDEGSPHLRWVVDGQQRLACLTMLFAAIRAAWAHHGDERADEVAEQFLGSKDRRTRVMKPRLSLNQINEPTFRDLVIEAAETAQMDAVANDRTVAETNRQLAEAAMFYRSAVLEWAGKRASYEEALVDLEEYVRDSVQVILVIVRDEADAYLVFETLNDRGLELSTSDLLKNYIFGHAGEANLPAVQGQWERIEDALDHKEETRFLRHYWLSRYGVVRERDLYRELRKTFSTPNKVLELAAELERASELYAAMSTVDHAFWTGYSTEARRHLEVLQLFGVTQFRPLLLAALTQFPKKEIEKLLRVIVVVSFRYSIIGSLGPGNIEQAYSATAIDIRVKKTRSAAAAFLALGSIYPDDDRFSADFAAKELRVAKLSRYVLAELAYAADSRCDQGQLRDEGKVNLEHIMPKRRTDRWSEAAPDQQMYLSFVHRIGNQTLLERDVNQSLGAKTFSQKKELGFSESKIEITKSICDWGDWTTNEIEQRQKKLAGLAVKAWSVEAGSS